MAAKTDSNESEMNLKSVFEQALKSYCDIDDRKLKQEEEQPQIKKTIHLLEEATKLINIGEVFSSNELLEEVPTECIQYLGIPCMLGVLVGRLQAGDRFSNLETSEVYFKDFLQRGKEYGLVPDTQHIDKAENLSAKDKITRDVLGRKEKLKRFEEQKKIQSDLVLLKENLERAEDEVRRKYFILFLKHLVYIAEEELNSIEMEKPLALMRKTAGDSGDKKRRLPPPPPLKPVIITKNELQKAVFGMGYPSLPTMTVDEFYEERVREGIFPASGSNYANSLQAREDPEVVERQEEENKVRKELLEETDDAEELERARAMDEYKDTHRRGHGNRYNRS